MISIKLLFTLQYECSPVSLLYILRTPFLKSTSGVLLLFCALSIIYTRWLAVSNSKTILSMYSFVKFFLVMIYLGKLLNKWHMKIIMLYKLYQHHRWRYKLDSDKWLSYPWYLLFGYVAPGGKEKFYSSNIYLYFSD